MSEWQVLRVELQLQLQLHPLQLSFQDPFSDQMNQSNENQQISKASGGANTLLEQSARLMLMLLAHLLRSLHSLLLVPRKLLFQERSLQTLLFVPRKLL
jgi:hypothetical protein